MSSPGDRISFITRAGLIGLAVLGFTGAGLYIAGEDPFLERAIVCVFLVLISVIVGAVIANESRKDRG